MKKKVIYIIILIAHRFRAMSNNLKMNRDVASVIADYLGENTWFAHVPGTPFQVPNVLVCRDVEPDSSGRRVKVIKLMVLANRKTRTIHLEDYVSAFLTAESPGSSRSAL